MAGDITAARQRERGFTLVEILVVMVIIGILATIAFATFLRQRTKAQEAAVESALRNAATSQETYFTEGDGYAPFETLLETEGYNRGDNIFTLTIDVTPDGSGYAMCTQHVGGGRAFLMRGNDGHSNSPAVPLAGRMPGVTCPPA